MIDPAAKVICDWNAAAAHLSGVDPVLAAIIRQVGPCTLAPRKDHFGALCQSIMNQQISMAAARTIWERFRRLFPRSRPTPGAMLTLTDEQLRGAGLSRSKVGYVRSLAAHFDSGAFPARKLAGMDDEQIVQALLPVKGIGRWTAEMFLIFVLNRTDLLPVDDLGLRTQFQRAYGKKTKPEARTMIRAAEKWRPFRSVATWYLWRSQAFLKPPAKVKVKSKVKVKGRA